MSLAACADLVERADPLRFRCVMAASHEVQDRLLPLYAFNVEISRAPWVTQEPMIAEMRLQWWRDVVEEIEKGDEVRSHDITQALCDVVRGQSIPTQLLDEMTTARRWDVYSDAFEDQDQFDTYINQTSGHLIWASFLALGGGASHETDVRNFAFGHGVAQMLQAAPELEARGRKPLYDGSPDGIKSIAKQSLARMYSCRQKGRAVAPALWPGYLAKPILRQAIETPEHVTTGALDISGFTRNWRLLRRQVLGMH